MQLTSKGVQDWELCKKLKFDPTTKWYMRNPAFIQENETPEILYNFWDTNGSTNPWRKARLNVDFKKRTYRLDIFCPCGPQSQNERNREHRRVLKSCQRKKKHLNIRVTVIPVVFGVLGMARYYIPCYHLAQESEGLSMRDLSYSRRDIGILDKVLVLAIYSF